MMSAAPDPALDGAAWDGAYGPVRRKEDARFLRGAPATEESFARAGELAAASCRPVSDQRGPADYKRHLACELTIRSLRRALQRARPEEQRPRQRGAAAHGGAPQDRG